MHTPEHVLVPGRKAARFFRSLAVGKGNPVIADAFAGANPWVEVAEIKAAVAAIGTSGAPGLAGWVPADFMAMVRPRTIVGRMGALRQVPLYTPLMLQTGGATAYWVPEGAPKPLSMLAFQDKEPLPACKVVAMAVLTQELAQFSEAEAIISADLGGAAVTALDLAFIDPANAGVPGERPAAITHASNGAIAVPPSDSGTNDAAAVRADFAALLAAFKGDLATASFVLGSDVAVSLALMGQAIGTVAIDARGGTGIVFGLPAIISSTAAGLVALVDEAAVQFGGAKEARLDTSRETSIAMSDGPTSPSTMVSMFQTNSTLLLAEIPVNWRVVRAGAVAYIPGAAYAP